MMPVAGPVVQGWTLNHPALDIACLPGAAVHATMDGYGSSRFDYLPRAILEVDAELAGHVHPELVIVPDVLLHYPAAAYLFVSPRRPELAEELLLHSTPELPDLELVNLARAGSPRCAALFSRLGMNRSAASPPPRQPVPLLSDDVALLERAHPRLRLKLLGRPECPEDLARQHLSAEELEPRSLAALHPRLFAEAHARLEAGDLGLEWAVLRNPGLPMAMAHRLICEGALSQRLAIALNPALSPELVVLLAREAEVAVVRHLCTRPDLPQAAARALEARGDVVWQLPRWRLEAFRNREP